MINPSLGASTTLAGNPFAPSAIVDTTNAGNLSSGKVPAARLGGIAADGMAVTPAGSATLTWAQMFASQTVNLAWYGVKCDGTTDDGPAIQAALNANPGNTTFCFPNSPNPCYINTGVIITKPGTRITSLGASLYVPNVTAFTINNAGDMVFSDLYIYGNRSVSAGNMLFSANNSARLRISNVRAELINTIGRINGGYFHTVDMIQARNIVQNGFILDKDANGNNGVDCFFTRIFNDSDGAHPTRAFIEIINFDAVNLNDFDLIHAGQVAIVWIRPQSGRSGDHLIGKGYFDIHLADAIRVEPASGAKSDRVNVVGTWIATGAVGIHYTGAGIIEDWNVRNSYIYNHLNQGILWDNTGTVPSICTISGNKFSGNNSAGGTASDITVGGTAPVNVSVLGNIFNDASVLSSGRPVHNIERPNSNATMDIPAGSNSWAFSGTTSSHTSP